MQHPHPKSSRKDQVNNTKRGEPQSKPGLKLAPEQYILSHKSPGLISHRDLHAKSRRPKTIRLNNQHAAKQHNQPRKRATSPSAGNHPNRSILLISSSAFFAELRLSTSVLDTRAGGGGGVCIPLASPSPSLPLEPCMPSLQFRDDDPAAGPSSPGEDSRWEKCLREGIGMLLGSGEFWKADQAYLGDCASAPPPPLPPLPPPPFFPFLASRPAVPPWFRTSRPCCPPPLPRPLLSLFPRAGVTDLLRSSPAAADSGA